MFLSYSRRVDTHSRTGLENTVSFSLYDIFCRFELSLCVFNSLCDKFGSGSELAVVLIARFCISIFCDPVHDGGHDRDDGSHVRDDSQVYKEGQQEEWSDELVDDVVGKPVVEPQEG